MIIEMKRCYWVIVENPNPGMPEWMMVYETYDLDKAVSVAKDQYGDMPQCKGMRAYVVLRDNWESGDRAPFVEVTPEG